MYSPAPIDLQVMKFKQLILLYICIILGDGKTLTVQICLVILLRNSRHLGKKN